VRQRICASLGLIIEDSASAVLERKGDVMSITCHDRFGPEGPAEERIPYASSFSALVLSAGQTIYVDDLELRPDLEVPRPKHGARFRSALGTPIRIQGKVMGTLEAYLPVVGRWTDMQAGLLESLAAQTAISIRNAELFEKVQHERRRFASAFRTAPFGLAICDDPEGREIQLNQAAALPFGLPAGEPIDSESPAGRRFSNSLYRGMKRLSEHELPQRLALSGVDVRGDEVEMRLPDGRAIALLASASPIYDGKGRISGAIAAFADITRQKELQRELETRRREAEEATNRKTRFLAAVSHDIRTPANAINLMAEIIKRSATNPHLVEQVPELAQRLQTNAVALIELVSDVLDLARYDSGRIDVQDSEFLLGELIENEVAKLRPLAAAKNLSVSVQALDAPIWLRSDAVKVSRILDNLLGNAVKFTAAGEVQLTSGIDEQGSAWFRVRDSGPGIHEKDFDRIFDEFQQLKNPERDARKGTGLGLAICRRLVEVLGARIIVESEIGKGSAFTVRFPASAAVSRHAVGSQPTPASPRTDSRGVDGIRVLLVEDHDTTRLGTAHILSAEGAVVTDVATGAAALTALEKDESDVLLLDMMLPDMDGREILARLRTARPAHLKAILVLTGDTTAERRAEVERLGADALLTKPIGVTKLLDVLELIRAKSSSRNG
jgi:PAS domain S-box-containing protein